ncbi:MAG TPA: hypothetical protein PKX17_03475 [Candidatus Methanomethylicus sp.]|nr:hypothetical protein [Candidatus Methanomethylicus sp.]
MKRISAFKVNSKGNINIGGLILGLVVSMIMIMIAVLLAGVLSAEVANQFIAFNVTGTAWDNLFKTTQSIAQSAIGIAIIGFLIAAFMVILGMFGVFGKKGTQ